MAFDGITIHALTNEFNSLLTGGRLNKIAQPEKDELLLTIKAPQGQYRLILSVNPSLPLAYITDNNKPSPMTAPNFCMLLRKHLNNGRIISITQPGLERIIDICIEHLDEMGDLCVKHLIVELMGKHSNIIFTDDNNRIIDSIKRVNASVSSVREVLPGLAYFIPNTEEKINPLTTTREEFLDKVCSKNVPIFKAIYTTYTGFSPVVAEELCVMCEIDSRCPATLLPDNAKIHLAGIFCNFVDEIVNNNYKPCITYDNNKPKDFFVIPPSSYREDSLKIFDTTSNMLENFYAEKNNINRIYQRSADLRQIINTHLERNYKKYDLQQKQLDDTANREQFKLYGELISAYAYQIEPNTKSCEVLNYYTNENVVIPMDEQLTPQENSRKYYEKYNKQKRTYEALNELIISTKTEIDLLESIKTSLEIATSYDDLIQIKEELSTYGFVKTKYIAKGRPEKSKSRPFHYLSSDGIDIYVGKNNIQNEELTFKFASGNDWWFHAKNMPGSHVIVKNPGRELPDNTYEEAAALAAYYSKGRDMEKVEIDYVEKKAVKKVPGAPLGFVIYNSNYSMNIAPDISKLTLISE